MRELPKRLPSAPPLALQPIPANPTSDPAPAQPWQRPVLPQAPVPIVRNKGNDYRDTMHADRLDASRSSRAEAYKIAGEEREEEAAIRREGRAEETAIRREGRAEDVAKRRAEAVERAKKEMAIFENNIRKDYDKYTYENLGGKVRTELAQKDFSLSVSRLGLQASELKGVLQGKMLEADKLVDAQNRAGQMLSLVKEARAKLESQMREQVFSMSFANGDERDEWIEERGILPGFTTWESLNSAEKQQVKDAVFHDPPQMGAQVKRQFQTNNSDRYEALTKAESSALSISGLTPEQASAHKGIFQELANSLDGIITMGNNAHKNVVMPGAYATGRPQGTPGNAPAGTPTTPNPSKSQVDAVTGRSSLPPNPSDYSPGIVPDDTPEPDSTASSITSGFLDKEGGTAGKRKTAEEVEEEEKAEYDKNKITHDVLDDTITAQLLNGSVDSWKWVLTNAAEPAWKALLESENAFALLGSVLTPAITAWIANKPDAKARLNDLREAAKKIPTGNGLGSHVGGQSSTKRLLKGSGSNGDKFKQFLDENKLKYKEFNKTPEAKDLEEKANRPKRQAESQADYDKDIAKANEKYEKARARHYDRAIGKHIEGKIAKVAKLAPRIGRAIAKKTGRGLGYKSGTATKLGGALGWSVIGYDVGMIIKNAKEAGDIPPEAQEAVNDLNSTTTYLMNNVYDDTNRTSWKPIDDNATEGNATQPSQLIRPDANATGAPQPDPFAPPPPITSGPPPLPAAKGSAIKPDTQGVGDFFRKGDE